VPAAAGVALGAVIGRPRVLRLLAAGLLLAAAVLATWQLSVGPQLRFDAADLLAGCGFVVALMSTAPRPSPRPAPASS